MSVFPSILLIDNYDSFVHNLARYLRELGCTTIVRRNDDITLTEVDRLAPRAVILSPGPCSPSEAGICLELIPHLLGRVPLLGVCLGHQALAQAMGGQVIRAPQPVHGQTSRVFHQATPLFRGLPNPFPAGRYHSLIVSETDLPAELQVTARTVDGLPMALEHRTAPAYGVQFHPESILTTGGHLLLANFLELAGVTAASCSRDHVRGDLVASEPPQEIAAPPYTSGPVPEPLEDLPAGSTPDSDWTNRALRVSAHW